MKKVKLFRENYWSIGVAQKTIDKWIKDNKIDVISASSTVGGDYFITTIVYEEKPDGFSLNS